MIIRIQRTGLIGRRGGWLINTLPIAILAVVGAVGTLRGQTINWESPIGTIFLDRYGNNLNESPSFGDFKFELGSFNDFIPTQQNASQWSANWELFSVASYNMIDYQFTGVGLMNLDGTSASVPTGFYDFRGKQAYMWIRNTDELLANTEWLLVTTTTWEFPTITDCCSGDILNWSTSDLGSLTPVVGSQSTTYVFEFDDNIQTMQTAYIPEPSSALVGLLVFALAMRRRRSDLLVK